MKRTRRFGVVAIAATAMLLLPGCLVLKNVSSAQLETIGDVRLSFTICGSDNTAPTTCADLGNTAAPAIDGNGQALVGLRLPTGVTAPPSFLSLDTALTMTQDATYSAELQRLSPAPAGQFWTGYTSQVRNFSTGSTSEFAFQPALKLPAAADGGPFATPFLWRAVSGLRSVSASLPSTRPIVCGAAIINSSDSGSTMCVDSPTPAVVVTNVTRSTRDLGIVAGGATASVEPGQAAVLNYTAAYSGTAAVAAAFTLTGSTSLPGATASPSVINYKPLTNQSAPVAMLVNVPANAIPGVYDVILKATATTIPSQVRQGVGKLTVLAPPVNAPPKLTPLAKYTAKLSSTRVRLPLLRITGAPNGARITVRCSGGGCRMAPALRTSKGAAVNLQGLFANKTLRPGLVIDIRVRQSGFIGRFFRFTFSKTGVKTVQCDIDAAGKNSRCIKV